MESLKSKSDAQFMHGRDECKHAHKKSHAMWCAMSEDDDNTNWQEDFVHIHLSGVAFHLHCVGRLVVLCHHAYAIPGFLHVVVRFYLVIVISNCSHIYCLLHIAKTGHLRCGPYTNRYNHRSSTRKRHRGNGGLRTVGIFCHGIVITCSHRPALYGKSTHSKLWRHFSRSLRTSSSEDKRSQLL